MKKIWNTLVDMYLKHQESKLIRSEDEHVRQAVKYAHTICAANNIGPGETYQNNSFRIYRGDSANGIPPRHQLDVVELEIDYLGRRVLDYSHNFVDRGEYEFYQVTRKKFEPSFLWLAHLQREAAQAEPMARQQQRAARYI